MRIVRIAFCFWVWIVFVFIMPCLAADSAWRIRLHEAAIVQGDMVLLGEIADIYGNPPVGLWEKLALRPLWPSPPTKGKPLQINKVRLEEALRQTLGDVADRCLIPTGMVIQRGGKVLREDDLRSLVVRDLTPQMRIMDGQTELADFRLPAYIFLAHSGQYVTLSPVTLEAGRNTLRFNLHEIDETILRKVTGSVTLEHWVNVPSAATPLNRGDPLTLDDIRWERVNLAAYRGGEVWDGRGGPWQMQRSLGIGQPISRNDLIPLAMIRKGAVVDLVYNQGNVHLSIKAEALEDGGPGDTIAVRNLQSKKQIYATVQDSNTVEVQ